MHDEEVRHTSLEWLPTCGRGAQAHHAATRNSSHSAIPWLWCECDDQNLQTQPREFGSYWTVRQQVTHLFPVGSTQHLFWGLWKGAIETRSRGTAIPTQTIYVSNPSVELIKHSAARGRNTIAVTALKSDLNPLDFRCSEAFFAGTNPFDAGDTWPTDILKLLAMGFPSSG